MGRGKLLPNRNSDGYWVLGSFLQSDVLFHFTQAVKEETVAKLRVKFYNRILWGNFQKDSARVAAGYHYQHMEDKARMGWLGSSARARFKQH